MCPRTPKTLQRFFADAAIIDDLLALRACVSLAVVAEGTRILVQPG